MPDAAPNELTDAQREAAAAAPGTMDYATPEPTSARPVPPRWAIHRRMYDWVIGFAKSPRASLALGGISFAESSFFPIPPDVLLMPLCMGERRKAWWFATVCTVASVLGGMLGYLIGYAFWEGTSQIWYDYIPGFTADKFATVEGLYDEWGVLILFAAAFTPIPFKVFTIAGGVFHQNFPLFVLVSLIGRGARFFLVAGLMWAFGQKITPFIDKYFNLLSLLFVIVGVGGFLAIKLLH